MPVDAITAQVRDEKNRLAAEACWSSLGGVGPDVRTLGPSGYILFWYSWYGCVCLSRTRSWQTDDAVDAFFVKALTALATGIHSVDVLLPLTLRGRRRSTKCAGSFWSIVLEQTGNASVNVLHSTARCLTHGYQSSRSIHSSTLVPQNQQKEFRTSQLTCCLHH